MLMLCAIAVPRCIKSQSEFIGVVKQSLGVLSYRHVIGVGAAGKGAFPMARIRPLDYAEVDSAMRAEFDLQVSTSGRTERQNSIPI